MTNVCLGSLHNIIVSDCPTVESRHIVGFLFLYQAQRRNFWRQYVAKVTSFFVSKVTP